MIGIKVSRPTMPNGAWSISRIFFSRGMGSVVGRQDLDRPVLEPADDGLDVVPGGKGGFILKLESNVLSFSSVSVK